MEQTEIKYQRKSYISIGEIYFWTATINEWKPLLQNEKFKNIIINSLQYLSDKGMIDVFAFVIMPNHIHLIWRINEMNGKETVQGAFLKYTAHEFKKELRRQSLAHLQEFKVLVCNKQFEFWQRDPFVTLPKLGQGNNRLLLV
ncbi:MAG: transposase [Cytophagaceae bacterium]